MKQLLILFLMLGAVSFSFAQDDNEAAQKVIIDQVDETDVTGGNARVNSQVWNTSPRLRGKQLAYTVVDNETGEEIEVQDKTGVTGASNRRRTPAPIVYVERNRTAAAIELDGTTIERRNRTEVNGEAVESDSDVLDLTSLPPGDYTIRAKNKKGKDKAELQVKIKGKKQNKAKKEKKKN